MQISAREGTKITENVLELKLTKLLKIIRKTCHDSIFEVLKQYLKSNIM